MFVAHALPGVAKQGGCDVLDGENKLLQAQCSAVRPEFNVKESVISIKQDVFTQKHT